MFILLLNGEDYLNGKFEKTNVLVKYRRIIKIGPFDYKDLDGPLNRLSFSSDAGVSSPTELWTEIRKCVLHHGVSFESILPHVTSVPAKVLKH